MYKKIFAALLIASFVFSAGPVLAKEGKGRGSDDDRRERSDKQEREGLLRANLFGFAKANKENFVVIGTLKTKGTNSITVTLKAGQKLGLANQDLLIGVNSDTKYDLIGDVDTFAGLVVGSTVKVTGKMEITVQNSLGADVNNLTTSVKLTASEVKNVAADNAQKEVKKQKAVGEITAKTDTSITIKNNVTGETKTITTTPETKVQINGETKTAADIKVGDKGWVKFKTTVSNSVSTMVAKFVNLFR